MGVPADQRGRVGCRIGRTACQSWARIMGTTRRKSSSLFLRARGTLRPVFRSEHGQFTQHAVPVLGQRRSEPLISYSGRRLLRSPVGNARADHMGQIGSTRVSPERGGEPMSHQRHRPPPHPADDRELKRTVIVGVAQGIAREALVIIWDWWHGGLR